MKAPTPLPERTDAIPARVRKRRRLSTVVVVSLVFLAVIVLIALIGPYLVRDPGKQTLSDVLLPPGTNGYLLGTDQLGRDELARVVHGLRSSLSIVVLATLVAAVFGTLIGMLAGYARGAFGEVVMRIVDVQLAIPVIILVLAAVTILTPRFSTIVLVLALAIWVVYARLARAQTLTLREQEMVMALRSMGASHTRILLNHVLRNISGSLLIITTLELANLIMAEAALGYLGLGVPPPQPTLGGMISEGQTTLIVGGWWTVVVPGVVIAGVILAVNIVGDWLRDRFDPRADRR